MDPASPEFKSAHSLVQSANLPQLKPCPFNEDKANPSIVWIGEVSDLKEIEEDVFVPNGCVIAFMLKLKGCKIKFGVFYLHGDDAQTRACLFSSTDPWINTGLVEVGKLRCAFCRLIGSAFPNGWSTRTIEGYNIKNIMGVYSLTFQERVKELRGVMPVVPVVPAAAAAAAAAPAKKRKRAVLKTAAAAALATKRKRACLNTKENAAKIAKNNDASPLEMNNIDLEVDTYGVRLPDFEQDDGQHGGELSFDTYNNFDSELESVCNDKHNEDEERREDDFDWDPFGLLETLDAELLR